MGLFKQFFLSVKWKAALFFGALVLLFNAGFLISTSLNEIEDLNANREQVHKQFKQDLTNEITRSSKKLQYLAELLLLPDNNLSVRQYLLTTTQLLNCSTIINAL
jgi:hypothetical protein